MAKNIEIDWCLTHEREWRVMGTTCDMMCRTVEAIVVLEEEKVDGKA